MCYYPDPLDDYIVFAVAGVNTFFAMACIGMITVGGLILTAITPYYNSVTEIILVVLYSDAIVMLCMGIIGLMIACVLYFSLCCASRGLIIAMIVVYILYVITLLILIILYEVNKSSLQTQMEDQWQENLQTYYKDPANSATLTSTTSYDYYWNDLMYTLQCCGAISYTDYNDAPLWIATYSYTNQYGVYTIVNSATIPVWCCKQLTTTFAIQNPIDWNCVVTPTTTNSYYTTNCKTALYTAVKEADFMLASLILSVLALVFAIIIIPALILAIEHHKWDIPEIMRNPKPPHKFIFAGGVAPHQGVTELYVDRTKPTVTLPNNYNSNAVSRSWNSGAPIIYSSQPESTPRMVTVEQMSVVNVR